MRFSPRKLLGTAMLVVVLAVSSFGGRPFIEAQQPGAVRTGDLADLLAATAEAANADYFLKLDGVDGEATDDRHRDWIEVLSYSWGATNAGGAGAGAGRGGGGADKVSMQAIHFTSSVSKASPKLFLAVAIGQHIKEAVLTVRKSGGEQQDFLVVKLTDVLVSSYQTGGSSGDVVPTDEYSLNFAKIEFEYKPQRADGSQDTAVRACYDLKQNKTC